ncbi:hypothetical protein ASD65_04765 [Microbacterium sp. Root61]|uniref:hypothetical protein n=1 Tax=Microbacterium sp. Root61 TaxID=1736570 RepID=UPI000700524F|nr:hypothetical protein [Microbacterium sp. Root61]KRA23809.1 hypothetical protein ASD65_04765 [Microbacterium sp. Root61]
MHDASTDALSPVQRIARALFSEDAIYGLILVSGLIVVSGTLTGESVGAFVTVFVTVAVFWAAHVYARTLSQYSRAGVDHNLRLALVAALRESSGMLIVAVPPLLVLLAGLTGILPDEAAIMGALVLDVLLLALVGWIAVARWSQSTMARVGGALMTAAFGAVLIAAKALIH